MPVWRLRAVDLRMCSQSESEVVASWTCEQPRALSWVSHKQEEERDLVGWDHLKQKTGVTEKEWGASCQKTSPQYHRVCCSIWNSSRRQYLFYRDIWKCFLSAVDVCLPWTSLTVSPHLLFLCLLLLIHLFLQILCWQRAPSEALLRLYNHRNHLHLHWSGFNGKCCWVFFFRWSFSSVCLMIAQISILTSHSSMLPTSYR